MQRVERRVAAVTTALTRTPAASPRAQVNSSPFDDAWMMKVKLSNPAGACCGCDVQAAEWLVFQIAAPLTRFRAAQIAEVKKLMDAKAYSAHCEAGGH